MGYTESKPVDTSKSIDSTSLKDQTILITGGAAGFGAAFFTQWASYGATVIIGDINHAAGEKLVAETRLKTKNENLHFLPLDVTDWLSQVSFFQQASRLSPTDGIDHVVANAGISGGDESMAFETPSIDYETARNPPPPSLKTLDVNMTGVMYTAHLAMYYLPRNPGSQACKAESVPSSSPGQGRDRHLLLIGSLASLLPLPGGVIYGVSKHGVMGLFRSLRYTAPLLHGIRVNILCPYFVDTAILDVGTKLLLAGGALGRVKDVVDAATRLTSDASITGRGLVIAPKVKVKSHVGGRSYTAEDFEVVEEGGTEVAIWDCSAHDPLEADAFAARVLGAINIASKANGWGRWAGDVVGALTMPLRRWWSH